MRLAAIDIGSNAARLLIAEVTHDTVGKPRFNKLNLVRVPLRLGFDVFEKGEISKEKRGMVLQTMKAYGHLLNAYGVKNVIACATSAMRDARNSGDLIRKIKLETGLDIEVISGDREASIIYENHVAENMDTDHSYMYIDVGGGSTELTFFAENKLVFKQSFNIGTIRLLKDMVDDGKWNEMKDAIKNRTRGFKKIVAIGTGGNINKVFSLSKRKDGKPLNIDLLKDYYKEIASFSLEDRINIYKLREDRADVIVPALQIYINIMRWSDTDEIYVPKIGLADGLIQHLYYELVAKNNVIS
ncbi:MAG: exopolyphosphatase [Chitinophagaceae bacterium]|nr:exopolyphosphatase [Chitinophagaceae bacterium]MDP1763782.1 exopolyphosphatase [Sediminibacterium sp.]MDP3667956.1 exopolyphosphatase [Sediminibacterium sp.]